LHNFSDTVIQVVKSIPLPAYWLLRNDHFWGQQQHLCCGFSFSTTANDSDDTITSDGNDDDGSAASTASIIWTVVFSPMMTYSLPVSHDSISLNSQA
jgi:hypothetical protein